MKKQITEQQLIELNQQHMQHSVDTVDSTVSSRLKQARLNALHGTPKQHPNVQWRSGFALASLLLVIMLFQLNTNQLEESYDDLMLVEEMLEIEENQEIVNDLDFYQWLDQQDHEGKLV